MAISKAIEDKLCVNCAGGAPAHHKGCPRPKFIGAPDKDGIASLDVLRREVEHRVPCYCDGDCRCTQKYALARLEDQLKEVSHGG